ncbi:hypothetical protein E4U42_004390 [Claviceps africana]|uniref:NCT transcriptional regulatory complex subunit A n=1 Tax=Claviceps africana TaxID=83212 RepID=A0A8K0J5S2_9HYPO|nr:hypothetical protein E4U42_004390 [Claviceps africana]
MSGDDGTSTYAPKSPDLSSFYSTGRDPGPTPSTPSTQPTQPTQPPQPASQLHFPSQASGQYKVHPPPYAHGSAYAPPMQFSAFPQQLQHSTSQFSAYCPPSQPYSSASPPNRAPYQLPPQTLYSLQPPHFPHTALASTSASASISTQDSSFPIPRQGSPRFRHFRPPYPAKASSSTSTQHDPNMPPRRVAAPAPPPPVVEPSPVKTKFPTARIKRIMQADEEVGKVAQQTPIAVGKALELFMIQMVSKSAEIAKEKGSKRVTASILKQVVETDDQWDFLRDIVSRVEHEKEGGKSRSKADSESDDDSEPKKRTRGSSRRKKS